MGLSEKDRQTVISLQIEKSERFLEQAREMYELKHWDLAANRYYYSCYHIMQALIINDGLSAKTHAGLLHLFGKQYILTNEFDSRYGIFLTKLMQLRHTADYNCAFDVTKEDVDEFAGVAVEFVKDVKDRLCKM